MNFLIVALAAIVLFAIIVAIGIRAAGGNIALVDHWTAFLKHYSTYALGLVAFLPEIFNEIVSGGYLDGTEVSETFSWANKAMVLFTFIVLKIKQAPKPSKPLFPNEYGVQDGYPHGRTHRPLHVDRASCRRNQPAPHERPAYCRAPDVWPLAGGGTSPYWQPGVRRAGRAGDYRRRVAPALRALQPEVLPGRH